MKTKFLLFTLLLVAFGITASAQFRTNRLNHHERLRIAQGVHNGSLTHGEAMRLRFENAGVNRYERRAASDGIITPKERRRTKMMERRLNRQIFIQKHDFQRR